MKTAASPKRALAPLPPLAYLEQQLDSLLILVEQESNLLRQGLAAQAGGIQSRMEPLLEVVVPLAENLKTRSPLPDSIRSKIDRIKQLQQAATEAASQHLARIADQLTRISGSQARLQSIRPVYGRPRGRSYAPQGSSIELRG